jgi:DNA-binding GntR family transcriptional regulator
MTTPRLHATPPAMETPRPLVHSLPEQIAERIAEDILEERTAPGTRLKEQALSSLFGVSRAPVREALRILETQKLVRITAQRGAVVVELSLAELQELFSIRSALMGLSIRKLTERARADELGALQARLDEVVALSRAPELGPYLRALGELSRFAAELAGPGWIRDFLVIAIHHTVRYSRRGLLTHAAAGEVTTRWQRLLDTMRAGDADAAEAQARALIMTAWRLAEPTLAAGRRDTGPP